MHLFYNSAKEVTFYFTGNSAASLPL